MRQEAIDYGEHLANSKDAAACALEKPRGWTCAVRRASWTRGAMGKGTNKKNPLHNGSGLRAG